MARDPKTGNTANNPDQWTNLNRYFDKEFNPLELVMMHPLAKKVVQACCGLQFLLNPFFLFDWWEWDGTDFDNIFVSIIFIMPVIVFVLITMVRAGKVREE